MGATVLSSFAGGISNGNAGVISAGRIGIVASNISTFSGGILNAGTISVSGSTPGIGISVTLISTFSGGISNSGTISGGANAGIAVIASGAVSVFDSGTITSTGTTAVDLSHNAAGNTFTLGPGFAITGLVKGQGSDTFQLGGTGTGAFNFDNIGTQYTGFTTFNVLSAAWVATGTSAASWTIFNGAQLTLGNGGTSGSITGNVVDNGTFAINRSDTYTFAGTITGSGSFAQTGTGKTVLMGATSYTGATQVILGTLQAGAANVFSASSTFGVASSAALNLANFDQTIGSLSGGGNVTLGSATLTTGGDNTNTTFLGAITGTGNLVKVGAGTFLLDGSSNSVGGVTINGGTLEVGDASHTSASLATTTLVDVVSGTLAGHGTVAGNVTVENGGTLMPGGSIGTLTINGNVIFNSGSVYEIALTPTQHSLTSVGGAVTINGGSVLVNPALGSANKIPILTSTGALTGTFSPTIAFGGSVNPIDASLSYDAHDVFLSVFLTLALPANAPLNAQNAVNALNSFILGGGTVPAGFQNLSNLSGNALNNAVNQLGGQVQGSFAPTSFMAGNMFLNLMLNPYVGGRGGFGGSGVVLPYRTRLLVRFELAGERLGAEGPDALFPPRLGA
jgi:autotransporter-associated beta strand protein